MDQDPIRQQSAQAVSHADLAHQTFVTAQSMQQTAQMMQNVVSQIGNTVNQQIKLQLHMEQWAARMSSQPVSVPPQQKRRFVFLRQLFSRPPKAPSRPY